MNIVNQDRKMALDNLSRLIFKELDPLLSEDF